MTDNMMDPMDNFMLDPMHDSMLDPGIDFPMTDPGQLFPDAEVYFGHDTQYFEGMHGRIDVSHDGGGSWETIS